MTLPPFFAAAPLSHIAPALAWGMAAVLGLLTLGTLAALALPVLQPGKDHTNLRQRIVTVAR